MGFSTISRYPVDKLELLKSIEKVCLQSEIRFTITKNTNSDNDRIEICAVKEYDPNAENEDYFFMDIIPVNEQIELFDHDPIKSNIDGTLFYMLTGTDQANYDHLIYDFSLEYLRLNPEHYITLYDETFYNLEDLEKIESEGGYYKDWCYGVSRPD